METFIANNFETTMEQFIGLLPSEIGALMSWILELPTPQAVLYLLVFAFIIAIPLLFIIDVLRYVLMFTLSAILMLRPIRRNILNDGGSKRVLIVGDSTAVGTGSVNHEETLMGMFAHDFPNVEMHNFGMKWALTRHVITQLKKVEHEHYTLAIISVGGNDVWRLTRLRKLSRDLNEILRRARTITDNRVVLLINNNIGLAPVFPIFIRDYIAYRSTKINRLFRVVASQHEIQCVDIYTEEDENPFMSNPNTFFARDGVHPSAKGYRLWYNRLWRVIVNSNYGLRG